MSNMAYDVMDLKALRCFWATAKHQSLTKAGIELGISDVAVSQRVKALERYLGVKLYESRGGHVRLTQAGERTAKMAVELFEHLEEFEQSIPAVEAATSISLSTHEPVLRYLLPNIVEEFKEKWPLARLVLKSRNIFETVNLVSTNEVDLGIVPIVDLPPEVEFHPIATHESYLIVPKEHPLARAGVDAIQLLLDQENLDQYQFVVPARHSQDLDRLTEYLSEHGLSYKIALEVGTEENVKHYVARGLGIAAISGLSLTESDRNLLETIEIPKAYGAETTYGVIFRRDKYRSAALQGLLAVLGVEHTGD